MDFGGGKEEVPAVTQATAINAAAVIYSETFLFGFLPGPSILCDAGEIAPPDAPGRPRSC